MSAHRLLSVIVCALLLFTGSRRGLIPTLSGWNGAQAQQERRALVPGTLVARVIADGEMHALSLRLDAGEIVHVFICQQGVNVAATLVGPDGTTLLDADSPNSTQEAEWITHLAATSGEYLVEVSAAAKEGYLADTVSRSKNGEKRRHPMIHACRRSEHSSMERGCSARRATRRRREIPGSGAAVPPVT